MLRPPGVAHGGGRRSGGFGLVELCVALGVIAIGAVWALTNYGDVISNNRLRSAGQQVYDALQLARSEAVKRNVAVAVSVSGTAVTLNLTPALACSAVGAACRQWSFGTGSGLTLALDPAAGAALSFDSHGELDADHWVDVTNSRCTAEQSCLRLLVRGGGTVRICNPAQGDASAPNFCA